VVEIVQDQGLAPKTFFISPDPAIVSEDFLESAFFHGFESYAVSQDQGGNLLRKIGIVIESFPETLVFFTVDRKGDLQFWCDFLETLQSSYPDRSRFGVLYSRPDSLGTDKKIKDRFLLDIGITGGCVPLQYSVNRNQSILMNVLAANQAAGRRKFIRMNCGPAFKINFLQEDVKVEGIMLDLSISHFSACFEGTDPGWEVGTKVKNVQLRLTGILLMVNVLVVIKRMTHGKPTYVFFFKTEDTNPGFDDLLKVKVNQVIFQRFQTHTLGHLETRFQEAGRSTTGGAR